MPRQAVGVHVYPGIAKTPVVSRESFDIAMAYQEKADKKKSAFGFADLVNTEVAQQALK